MSGRDHELESWKRAWATVSNRTQPRGEGCPEPSVIWQAANGELEPRAVMPVLDHVTTCQSCAQAWQLARQVELEFVREKKVGEDGTSVRRRLYSLLSRLLGRREEVTPIDLAAGVEGGAVAGSRAAWRWVAAAGLFFAVGALVMQQGADNGPALRGGDRAITSVISVEDTLRREEFRLSWWGPPDQRYTVVVFAHDGAEQIYFQQDLRVQELLVPETAFEGLAKGELIDWTVETTLADGSSVSGSFATRLD